MPKGFTDTIFWYDGGHQEHNGIITQQVAAVYSLFLFPLWPTSDPMSPFYAVSDSISVISTHCFTSCFSFFVSVFGRNSEVFSPCFWPFRPGVKSGETNTKNILWQLLSLTSRFPDAWRVSEANVHLLHRDPLKHSPPESLFLGSSCRTQII